MKKFITNKYVLTILGTLLFLLIWFVVALIFDQQNTIIPTPFETGKEMINLLGQAYTYKCLGFTLLRVILGFSISFVFAFIFGVIAGNNEAIRNLFKPTMTILKSVPTAAVVFLFVVIFAPKNAPMFVTMLISFPILYEAVVSGITNVSVDVIKASKMDGANIVKRNICIYVPLALPYIGVGVLSSFSLSFKIEIMAEIITGYTQNGIGSAINASMNNDPTNMIPVFAYSLIVIILVLIISLLADKFKKILKTK